jgi:hypothetical protein
MAGPTLGLSIQSQEAVSAAADMDQFVASAGKAERGAQGVGRASREMAAAIGSVTAVLANIERHTSATASAMERGQKATEMATRSYGQADLVMQRFIERQTGVARATAQWEGPLANVSDELDRMRARFNPLFAAQQRFESATAEINRAQRLGAITADEATAAVMREQAAYDGLTASLRANQAAATAARTVNAAHTTNLLFQAQDIAMMTAMGQNPMMLAMQQGTQVGGVFHQIGNSRQIVQALGGAVMGLLNPLNLATIAAIGLGAAGVQAFVGMLNSGEDATRTLEDHVAWLSELLRGYVRDYIEEASRLPASLARLEIGGQIAEDLRLLEMVQNRIENFRIRDDAFLTFGSINEDLAVLRQIKGEFDANIISAEEFAQKLQLIQMNDNVDAEVRRIAGEFYNATREAAELEARIGGAQMALAGLSDEAAIAATRMANLRASFDMLGSGDFTNAGLEAALQAPIDAMEKIQGMVPEIRTQQEVAADLLAEALNSPSAAVRDQAQEAFDQFVRNTDILTARREASRSARGQSPTDRWGSANDNFQQRIDQLHLEIELFGQSTYEVARQQAAFDLLNQAKQAGIPITATVTDQINSMSSEYAAATVQLEMMARQQQQATQINSQLASGFSSLFTGILDGSKSAVEGIGDLLRSLGQLLINQAFQTLFSPAAAGGLGWGIGGGGGGLLGGMIIPGILHDGGIAGLHGYGHSRAFPATIWASAPRYHNGGIAGLKPNEVPAILERGERVIPANGNSGSANQNQKVQVTINVNGATGNAEVQRMVAEGVAQGMKTVERNFGNMQTEYQMRNG